MKTRTRKIEIARETLRRLSPLELSKAAGGEHGGHLGGSIGAACVGTFSRVICD